MVISFYELLSTNYELVFAQAQGLQVGAQVDKTEVARGEAFTFSVTISGEIRETPKVHLTSFEGFQIVSTGQSQQIQIQSGQSRLTLTLRYSLAPTEVGTHTLGPVKVEYHGQIYETQPIEVKVVPGPAREKPSPRRKLPRRHRLEGGVVL